MTDGGGQGVVGRGEVVNDLPTVETPFSGFTSVGSPVTGRVVVIKGKIHDGKRKRRGRC